jgi:hypothetical protein
MTFRTHYLAAAAAIGALAVPAAAQTAYPYGAQPSYPQYQQPYTPQQPYPAYGAPAYGYSQGYTAQNPVGQIIDSLLGNRYNVTDRQAVSRCASAAMTQAESELGRRYAQGYGSPGYNRGYNNGLRVTAITDVQRRSSGLRVKGTMSSAYSGYNGGYGGQYANQNRSYGDVSFRCNVAYNGAVTDVRIGRAQAYRR